MIMIVGANGSMGGRYQAILKYLGKKFSCIDIDYKVDAFKKIADECEGVIIASPTPSHFFFLDLFSRRKIPVLCEKPLSTSRDHLEVIKDIFVNERGLNLTMMMQYKMLDQHDSDGNTSYDYFRHGNDGLIWDCLQPIALARGQVEIRGASPIWNCTLNGKKLSLGDMDKAYVDFVYRWLMNPGDDMDRLFDIHLKVMDWENGKKH